MIRYDPRRACISAESNTWENQAMVSIRQHVRHNQHGGATAEGEDAAMLGVNQAITTDTITTVQCDTCGKWRHTPYRHDQLPEGAWYCSMNTWDVYNSCEAPEQ